MSQSAPAAANRLEFIEGLKGIGAMQVVVLHYISAFFPPMARFDGAPHYAFETWAATSPLFFLYNGFAAFNLFFLMSGFVLAPSFARISGGWLNQAARRLFRLFVPMAAAYLIAIFLLLAFPHAKADAIAATNSGWLAGGENNPMTLASLAKDMFLNSMILGYGERSWFANFPFMQPYLTTWAQSINGPFWTLHIILWGSLLLLLATWLRQRLPRAPFWGAMFGLFLITGTGGFSMFLIGYALYDLYQFIQKQDARAIGMIGLVCLLAGIYTINVKEFPVLHPIFDLQNSIRQGPTLYNEWLNEVGAILVFMGALMFAPAKKFLSLPGFTWLGRISFSLFLTHFPILFTISCALFAATASLGYATGFLITAAVGIALSLLLANIFEKWVDVPAIALTKRLFSPQVRN